MRGLMQSIPGLSKHETVVPPSLDSRKASRLIREAISLLSSYYPTGALEWIREERPDLYAKLREAERTVDEVAKGDEVGPLRKALDEYVTAHRRAFSAYEGRPPVIQQRGLFCV